MRSACESDQGFSLVEVLVAFVIASISLIAIYQAIGGSYRAFFRSEIYNEAVLETQSRLALLTAEGAVADKGAKGRFNGGVTWRLLIEDVSMRDPSRESIRPRWVEITTYDRDGKRLTKVRTIILATNR